MVSERFRFFVTGREKEITPDTGLWQHPLSGKNPVSETHSDITVGEYLSAAASYLSQNDFSHLRKGIDLLLGRRFQNSEIRDICLFLEKHGAFYHPIKVSVNLVGGKYVNFVINGAVSLTGLSLVESEYKLISMLNQKFRLNPFLPKVFGCGMIETGVHEAGFFLGQWFDGFKEFHITRHQGEEKTVLWHSDGRISYLTVSDTLPIYRKIAYTLTTLYDLETFEQVFSWHHAAGDFIVRLDNDRVQVRLITVRGYSPLIEFDLPEDETGGTILMSLLMFFIGLTVQIRLDRLDGTGEPVFLDDRVVMETVKGFFSALEEKSQQSDYKEIPGVFKSFLRQFDREQLLQIAKEVLESHSYPPVEMQLIMEHIHSHCRILYSIFKNI